jgi:hypothetical protein
MTRAEWIAKAMELAEAMAELHGAADNAYNHGVGDVETQAESARAEYAAAQAALAAHLATGQPK